jgi:phosphopantothenoylcysteine decarboxylase/phosphopantothenate--cysteine ligase
MVWGPELYVNYILNLKNTFYALNLHKSHKQPMIDEFGAREIHPSKDIISSTDKLLEGRLIAMGICGSVAAARSPDLARQLMRHGAEVRAFMTGAAQKLISPMLMEWATGNPVVTELTGGLEHVAMGGSPGRSDLVLVAPATANTIGKIAVGIDDTPVTTLVTTAMGAGIPIVLAPAMHGSMYAHPAVAENLKKIEAMGILVIGPLWEEGKAKVAQNEEIVEGVVSGLCKKDMVGQRIMVTAGPTRSPMDAVRYLTNSSSGKMGVSFAMEASARGADVLLITGAAGTPCGRFRTIKISSTEAMLEAVGSELGSSHYDLLVLAAAPLDFAFGDRKEGKVTSDSPVTMTLVPIPKVYDVARKIMPRLFIIGFKAEYGLGEKELLSRAQHRLTASAMELIVANDLSKQGAGFESETNEVHILDRNGLVEHIPLSPKRAVARRVLDLYMERRGSCATW